MERINVEEVYGEPIDEEDLIFKLSNSGKKANMGVGDFILNAYRANEKQNDKYFQIPTGFIISDEMIIRIANDRHEGILIDRLKEFEENEK